MSPGVFLTLTATVAVAQAIAAFGTAFLLYQFGDGGIGYPILFIVSSTALAIAFAVDFVIRK
jgi:predicted permease